MKKIFLAFSTVVSINVAMAQTGNTVVIGKFDSVYSSVLKEQRHLLVYTPGAGNPSTQKFPVVYLLDGEAHFNSVVGMIEQLSSINGNTLCPQMIVVGITNTNRMRDLTPTKTKPELPFMDSATAAMTGGGGQFFSFMEEELMPYINSKYPTAPYKMLIGHSLGGLMAIDALVHHTNLFNAYVAIDPSMWYNDRVLLKETEKALKERSFAGKALYLGVANTVSAGQDTTWAKKDTGAFTNHIRSVLTLSQYLNNTPKNGLMAKWKYYADDDHGSVPLITEYDALRFFFSDYRLQQEISDFTDPAKRVDQKLSTHYKKVSTILGYEQLPPEDMVNSLGYQVMGSRQLDKAEQLFIMNTVNYPGSTNVFDSLGDLYAAKGDKAKAIENYKKALVRKEVPDTRKKLDALLK